MRKAFRGFGLGRELAEATLDRRGRPGTPVPLDTLTIWSQPARCTPIWALKKSRPTITTPYPGRITSRSIFLTI